MSLYHELKRRNVFRVATAYIVTSWLLLQVADVILNNFAAPGWLFHVLILALGIGFPLALVVSWAFEFTPQGVKRDSEVELSQPYITQSNRKLDFMIIGVLTVALSYFTYDKLVLSSQREAALVEATTQAVEDEATAKAELLAKARKSIAVLPFVNMSQDASDDYFSDGISEELLNVLAKFPELRVAARTSSFQFKGLTPNMEDVARVLHVNHVLEGSVRKSGDRVRITAQLIRTATGFHIWSETYDRELVDIFAIQDEISAAIGGALKIQLDLEDGSGRAAPTVRAAANVEAFEAYMQGRQLINKRGRPNLEQAVVQLERALVLDKNYAPAHAQLAIAIIMLSGGVYGLGDLTLEEVVQRATPYIDRATELDDQLPEAYAARASLAILSNDPNSVIVNGTRALEINASYADVNNWLFLANVNLGRFVEAVNALERAVLVDPLSIAGRTNLAYIKALRGQPEAARKMVSSVAEQSPMVSYAKRAQLLLDVEGEPAEALRWALKAFVLSPDGSALQAYMSEMLGQLDLLPEALRLEEEVHLWAYQGLKMWPELLVAARQRFDANPTNRDNKVYLADALHLSGEIEQAQILYEEMLSQLAGRPVYYPMYATLEPTARAAFGRLNSGDAKGADELVKLAMQWQREHARAELRGNGYYRAGAILAGLEGDQATALLNLENAISSGLRDRSVFSEPALQAFRDVPQFHELEARLEAILASEREKALQMICFNNPVADAWQPLASTCEGVEAAP